MASAGRNPLRYVVEQNGYGEEPEWGAINDPAGYRALKSIDSYQSVKDGTAYPAVLLTTGVTDPRVAPFHVAKMAARLQAATSSGNPFCCASTMTPATGWDRLARNRTARLPIPTRFCSGSCADSSAAGACAGAAQVNRAFLHDETADVR